jgi:dTDP-4-amino-4,6-dideoxygalactose transaminase
VAPNVTRQLEARQKPQNNLINGDSAAVASRAGAATLPPSRRAAQAFRKRLRREIMAAHTKAHLSPVSTIAGLLETLGNLTERNARLIEKLERISPQIKDRAADAPAESELPAGPLEETARTIYVTRPFLPPLSEFTALLETIWSSRILTNNGPLHQQFETALAEYLGVGQIALVSSGAQALSVALQVLAMSGEVITTPYSFVATSHAIKLASLTPVFVDIRADDFNIDPRQIEDAITPRTVAIMPVHCYGNPCDTEVIAEIARRRGLRVIYDGAHAFGVTKNDATILENGDFTTLSFHATKAFNTFEGGAIIAPSAESKLAINRMKNFGFRDELTVDSVGGNAKMSELNAAIGLLQLKYFDHVRLARQRVDARYRAGLAGVDGIAIPRTPAGVRANCSYFPIRVRRSFPLSRDQLYERLKQVGIITRRYFYPLLTSFPMYAELPSADEAKLPNAALAAKEILCLPIYPELSASDQDRIIDIIASA